MEPQVLLIAIDSADIGFARSGIEQGLMPCLARLVSDGCWGPLRSTMPPVSCPAWISMRTGKNPDKLGVYQFGRLRPGSYAVELVDFQVPDTAFWEVLSDQGTRVGIAAIHMTYPPPPINGVMVSPVYARSDEYTYPPEFQRELEARIGRLEYTPANRERFLANLAEDHRRIEENRFRLIEAVWSKDEFDFFACGFDIDKIHHYVADTEQLLSYYADLDRMLERTLALIQPRNVVVVSDHGGGPIKGYFYTNAWLQERGFLKYHTEPVASRLLRHSPVASMYRILERTGTLGWARALVPGRDLRQKMRYGNEPPFDHTSHWIDWAHTTAFSPHSNAIYINRQGRFPQGIVSPDEYPDILDQVAAALQETADPVTGEPWTVEIQVSTQSQERLFGMDMPDIIFFSPDYPDSDAFRRGAFKDLKEGRKIGYHRRDGLFVASGVDIASCGELSTPSIVDVAPTILHLMNAPIPDDMDGRVLWEIFKPTTRAGQREPHYVPADTFKRERSVRREDAAVVEERLRALGYFE